MENFFIAVLVLSGLLFMVLWAGALHIRLPRRYPEWRSHQIIKQDNRDKKGPLSLIMPYEFVCQICLQSWTSAEFISKRCPGLPVYDRWLPRDKPAYLVTAKELEVLGYNKPSDPPLGYLKADLMYGDSEWTPLYDERTAEREVQALPKS